MVNTKDGIIGFIIGDALGVPVENIEKKVLDKNPIKDMIGINKEVGTFSDDTSLTLATIDSFLESNKIDYNDIAKKYQDYINFSRYTADGELFDVGRTTLLSAMKYSQENPIKCGDDSFHSNDNSSIKRMVPLAYMLYSKKDSELKDEVRNFSSMTNRHEISILGCYIYVKYIQFLLQGKSKEISFKLLKELNYEDFTEDSLKSYNRIFNNNILIEEVTSNGNIVSTLECVLYSILTTESYKEAVLRAVNIGGTTDTTAALTGALAGIIYGYRSIDETWILKLKKNRIIFKVCDYFSELVNIKNQKRW